MVNTRVPKSGKDGKATRKCQTSVDSLAGAVEQGRGSQRARSADRHGHVSRPEVAAALYALGPPYHDDDDLWLTVGQALWSWDRSENTRDLWAAWSGKSG